mmetsp:Transcript_44642/g.89644  ORF Transcript_44642/g.89644 Transcript_44642/m.89644 type:complete len:102 (-) Transcript_44642:203-508(-)
MPFAIESPMKTQEDILASLDNTLSVVSALQSVGDDVQTPEWNAEMSAKAVSLHDRVSASIQELSHAFETLDEPTDLVKLKTDIIKTVEADVAKRLSSFKGK